MRKKKKVRMVNEDVAILKRLLSSGGLQLVHEGRYRRFLQRAEEAANKGGRLPASQLIVEIHEICQLLCEEILTNTEGRR